MGGQNITVVCARTKTKDKETIFLSLWYKSSVIFTSGGLTECSEEKTVQITILFILWRSQTDLHPVSPPRSHLFTRKTPRFCYRIIPVLSFFFVKCGVLAEALERVLKLWIRLGRDAIFDTLKTLFESSLRPNADRNFPASHVPGFVGIRTTRARNQCFQRFATQKNTRAECFAICFYPRMVRTSCAIFSWCHTPQSQRGSSSPGV